VLRLLKQLSEVYSTMRISTLAGLVPFMPFSEVEGVVVDAVKCDYLQVRVSRLGEGDVAGAGKPGATHLPCWLVGGECIFAWLGLMSSCNATPHKLSSWSCWYQGHKDVCELGLAVSCPGLIQAYLVRRPKGQYFPVTHAVDVRMCLVCAHVPVRVLGTTCFATLRAHPTPACPHVELAPVHDDA